MKRCPCSALWCSAADSNLKLLVRVVRSVGFLAGGVLECNLAHRATLPNPMHPLSIALPQPSVPARVTRGALIAHRHLFPPPRCRTSQYHRTFVPLSVSLWNDLSALVFDGVGLAGFKSRANASCWEVLLFLFCLLLFYLFLPSMGWLCGVVFGLSVLTLLSALHSGLH